MAIVTKKIRAPQQGSTGITLNGCFKPYEFFLPIRVLYLSSHTVVRHYENLCLTIGRAR